MITRTEGEAGAVRGSFSKELVFWLRLQGETKPAMQGYRGRAVRAERVASTKVL